MQYETYAMHEYITKMLQNQKKAKNKDLVYKTKKSRKKYTICYKDQKIQLKMGSKHQARLANEQKWLDPKVW